MNELVYPFDAKYIMAKRKKIKKQLLGEKQDFLTKRVAILGGVTTSDIKLTLELFLLNYGIAPEFYESEYNQFYQDAVFENDELKEFAPDIVYVCTSSKNILSYPVMTDSDEAVKEKLTADFARYKQIWESIKDKYNRPIIQNNFDMPYYRLLGNRDAYDIHGAVNYLNRLNLLFADYAKEHNNFYICDLNYISADYGLKKWSDPFYWYMYKMAVSVDAIPYIAHNVANIIKSIFGKNKKGFVLDLDNTLWGGVIGDDGVDNIVLGPEESEGQAYTAFQKYIKAHSNLGVVLTINSKNDYENAISGIKHRDSEFLEEDFAVIKANWNPKDHNFSEIANTLNLLPESLLFIDDNPAERHIVSSQIGDVIAPELTDISHYIETIDRGGYFEVTSLSDDDLKRNRMYVENAKRVQLEASYENYGQYLDSLEMKAEIKSFESIYMSRIAQLTNKSNQFNLTTRRYTQTEIEAIAKDSDYITLYGKLEDRFGDNGVVSVVIGQIEGKICHIRLWLMSCRVLKRDMEFAMMDTLAGVCRDKEIEEIRGYYYPTAKNHMVEKFYEIQGFELSNCDEQGNTEWGMKLKNYINKNNHIVVN